MKHATTRIPTLLGTCMLALLAVRAGAEPPTGPQRAAAVGADLIGTQAPALVVTTIDGRSIDLGALYGKQAVYLKFWATWCVPCRRQMPHFEHVYETAGPDLAVIAVNTGFNDSLPDVRAVIREAGLKMPMVVDDGRLAAAFDLRVTPQHVVIGRDGKIDYVGWLADDRLDAALRAAQEAPPPARGRAAAPALARAAPAASAVERFSVGDRLPDLSAMTLDGRRFRLHDASDRRPTALVFLSPWCESTYLASQRPAISTNCRQVREQVAALASRGDAVRWLGVASGLWSTPGELRTYEAKYAPRIPLMMDESGVWFHAFGVMRTPTIVIANATGTVVKRVQGFDPALADEVARAGDP